ncbi:hypothetical protein QFZ73_003630 [Peribacillus sp. V2I11]|nr:hypothetical protein [Peribacillus sp. V2I11]
MQYLTLNDKCIKNVAFMSNNGYKQLLNCNKHHFLKKLLFKYEHYELGSNAHKTILILTEMGLY